MKESFWAKVLFREYTSHYIAMTPEERAKDVQDGIVALARLDPSGSSFGAKMVQWAQERQESKAAVASAENGKKGGRPPSNMKNEPPRRCPRNKQEFEEFIYDPANNLNTEKAWQWFDIHKNRNWTFQDGSPITNWKGAIKNFCKEENNA